MPSFIRAALFVASTIFASAYAQEVIPDFYKDPGLYPNRAYVNQSGNEYIDPFSGSLQRQYIDLHIPGNGGLDIQVIRSYNSTRIDSLNPAALDSGVAPGWSIHFGRVLKSRTSDICVNTNAMSTIDNPVLELPDGSRQLLAFTGGTAPLMLTAQRWRADCNATGNGLIVYAPDGRRFDMGQLVNTGTASAPVYAWYTTRITDRNDNWIAVSYAAGSTHEMTGLSSKDGRTVTFAYEGSDQATRRITSISGAGKRYEYVYHPIAGVAGKYALTSVTRPDGLSWKYTYNGSTGQSPGGYLISSVVHPQGGTVAYGYGQMYFDSQANPASLSTVVQTKTLSTGGTWTFSYMPGGVGGLDETRIVSPAGTTIYRHYGPNFSSSGSVWMVGLLASKKDGDARTETYTWTKQKLGSENYLRPGAFVLKVDPGETNAPVLARSLIEQDGAAYDTSYANFDVYGNPQTITESGAGGGNRTTARTYFASAAKWIVKQLQNESYSGTSTARTFDVNGNLTSISVDGITTSYRYDAQGNTTAIVYPRNLTHTFGEHKRGIAQTETRPEGIQIAREVSDAGNVTSERDGVGNVTRYSYDGLDRLTQVRRPIGNEVALTYSANSHTLSRGALTQTSTLDGFGRITGVNTAGVIRAYGFDAMGRRTYESNPGTPTVGTSYQYDVLNRVTAIGNPDGTSRRLQYGAGSTTSVDENGRATTYSFRSYGDPRQQVLMGVTAPDPAMSMAFSRNARDQLDFANGVVASYSQNSRQFTSAISVKHSGLALQDERYAYDLAGNLTSINDAADAAYNRSLQYDSVNRLVAASGPWGAASIAYDARGNITSQSFGGSALYYVYDAGKPPVEGDTKPGPASRPSERDKGGKSLWDDNGGEWRYSPEDKWHNPHWDYNPHDKPNSPWQNVPIGTLPPRK